MSDVNQVANAVGISRKRVENIPHNELGAFWSRSRQFSWKSPHPRWMLEPPLRARDQKTIHAEETPLFSPLQRRPKWCHQQERWWPPSSEMQRHYWYRLLTCHLVLLSQNNTLFTQFGMVNYAFVALLFCFRVSILEHNMRTLVQYINIDEVIHIHNIPPPKEKVLTI